jgi:hypothetical protein
MMKRGVRAPLTQGAGLTRFFFCTGRTGEKGRVVSTAQREKERQGGGVCEGRGAFDVSTSNVNRGLACGDTGRQR